ncbi:Uncharacterised protein [Klebsiella pneumoniae]|uniref:hypothetical protein n=1 Tax=Klebsiella pneumoniae TaxID=573 RepID=UPI000E2CE991|nr:hypothetical protein [Klebsiella pneumoniae]SYU52978.1 Uncharacterised protein [Klebsiella pneumoniae]
MARAFSAVERREYVRAVIRITRHQGRLTTTEAMKKLGLFRDHRAVIDFDMKRFGLVPKVAVGMNYSLLGSPVFQRVLDVQEAIHG